ncbi:MAG: hypothetical protein LBG96_14870 [Tannerella sp.]|jgi:hypothetical protein|nr:hypothetical protein [Tannerella sp.]
MMNEKNILGCFVSNTADARWSENERNFVFEQGRLFRGYLWGKKGISETLKHLNKEDYGSDLVMILFQFYIKPIPELLENLKEIESYRSKEKSIGIPIIITEENFFSKAEEERYSFLQESILQKLDLLAEVVKKKKLDTNITLLKSDLQKLFISHN